MNRIAKKCWCIILVLVFVSIVTGETKSSLNDFQWLVGEWIVMGAKSTTTETWEQVSTHTFEGSGITRRTETGEIVNDESLRLVSMSGDIFYIAMVAHNERPISFKLTKCTDSLAVFENPAHDFPTAIEYRRIALDKMNVTVRNSQRSFVLQFTKQEK